MTKAGERLIEGAKEALAVARGEQPAASIHVNGHTYVPKNSLPPDHIWLVTYEDGHQSYAGVNPGLGPSGNGVIVSVEHMVRDTSQSARLAELESELAACKIALEQAWESNRERQAEIERLIQKVESHRLIQKKYKNSRDNARYGARAVDQGLRHWRAKAEELAAENERLVRNAQTEAWLLAGYHRICERHGVAPSSAELIAAAKEVEDEQVS